MLFVGFLSSQYSTEDPLPGVLEEPDVSHYENQPQPMSILQVCQSGLTHEPFNIQFQHTSYLGTTTCFSAKQYPVFYRAYVVFVSLKHFLQRLLNPSSLQRSRGARISIFWIRIRYDSFLCIQVEVRAWSKQTECETTPIGGQIVTVLLCCTACRLELWDSDSVFIT